MWVGNMGYLWEASPLTLIYMYLGTYLKYSLPSTYAMDFAGRGRK